MMARRGERTPNNIVTVETSTQPVVVDFRREGDSIQLFKRPPLLTSHRFAWEGVSVEHHVQDGIEADEHITPAHLIVVKLNGTIRGERWIESKLLKESQDSGFVSLLPSDSRHRYATHQTGEFLTIALDPAFVSRTALTTFNHHKVELTPRFATEADPLILGVGTAFLQELEAGCPAGRLYADSLATALAVHLVRNYAVMPPVVREYKGGIPSRRLRRAIDHINDNLAEDIALSNLAGVVGMSTHHFGRTFKQATGYAPHAYLIRQRIESAKRLLMETELPIVEVALAVGFVDQSHFARAFRRLVGVTPNRFRRER